MRWFEVIYSSMRIFICLYSSFDLSIFDQSQLEAWQLDKELIPASFLLFHNFQHSCEHFLENSRKSPQNYFDVFVAFPGKFKKLSAKIFWNLLLHFLVNSRNCLQKYSEICCYIFLKIQGIVCKNILNLLSHFLVNSRNSPQIYSEICCRIFW